MAPHLVLWRPLDLQWQVYQAILEGWVTGEVRKPWLEARITLLYEKGDPSQAANYKPIPVSGAMYLILARLLLGALKDRIEQSLSARHAGGKRGETPAQHALAMLASLHAKDNEEAYVCLIDIAKAYPSMPHPAITFSLQAIGTPQHLIDMIRDVYDMSTLQYGSFVYSLERGVKEGYPLSPSLLVLVSEAFHHMLATKLPDLGIYVYMDDIDIVANNLTHLKGAMNRISELSQILGFQVNQGKTKL